MEDKPELGQLPSEVLTAIMEHCHDKTLANLCLTNKRIHDHAWRERRLRLQETNFGLLEQPDEAQHIERTRGLPIMPGWPRSPPLWGDDHIDIVTRVMWQDNLPVFKVFLEWGMNIRHFNSDGWTILSIAFRLSGRKIFRYLQANNMILPSDVSAPVSAEKNIHTIASSMVRDGKDGIIQYLIGLAGNDFFQARDVPSAMQGYSTLRSETIAQIVPMGYPLLIQDQTTLHTPLHHAMINADPAMLDVVLAHSTPDFINTPGLNGQTCLWLALDSRNYDDMEMLLVHGADPTLEDVDGWTVLHFACHRQDIAAVRLFLDHGAKPNQGDKTLVGTPLHCLCRSILNSPLLERDNHREKASQVYTIMLARGAVTNVSTSLGDTLQSLLNEIPAGFLTDMGDLDSA